MYDLLHIGHIELFRKARKLGTRLIVAVQRSEDVGRFKEGVTPVCTTEERCYMVKSVRYVDEVVEYSEVTDIPGRVEFDIFVKGPDQNHDGFRKVEEWCMVHGKKVVTLPRTEGISSTQLKELIRGIE